MSRMGSHDPFGHLKHKLWAKERLGVKLPICDALLGLGVNPLEGSPNVKLRKLGPKGTLSASNSRKG